MGRMGSSAGIRGSDTNLRRNNSELGKEPKVMDTMENSGRIEISGPWKQFIRSEVEQ